MLAPAPPSEIKVHDSIHDMPRMPLLTLYVLLVGPAVAVGDSDTAISINQCTMRPRQGGAFLRQDGCCDSRYSHATSMSSYTIADSWVPAGQRSGDQTCIMWMHWLRDGRVVGRGHRRGHILQHVIGMVGTATWTRTAIDRAIVVSHVDIIYAHGRARGDMGPRG